MPNNNVSDERAKFIGNLVEIALNKSKMGK